MGRLIIERGLFLWQAGYRRAGRHIAVGAAVSWAACSCVCSATPSVYDATFTPTTRPGSPKPAGTRSADPGRATRDSPAPRLVLANCAAPSADPGRATRNSSAPRLALANCAGSSAAPGRPPPNTPAPRLPPATGPAPSPAPAGPPRDSPTRRIALANCGSPSG